METTQTSQAKIYNKIFSSGFTLFEILAVIVLIGVATTIGFRLLSSQSNRDDLDTVKEVLERNINFASSEATIRNRIIRIVLHLDKTPQSYSIEIASSAQLLLPEVVDDSLFSKKKDEDALKKEMAKFNQSFTALDGVKADDFSIDIQIIAAANLESEKLTLKGDFPIYFYPSGEKDPALLIISTEKEIMGLSIDPFRERIKTKYFARDNREAKDAAQEIFKEWEK